VISFQFEILPGVGGIRVLIDVCVVPRITAADIPAHTIMLKVELARAIQPGRDSDMLVSDIAGVILP
jgi:hypothetical protein